MDENSKIVDTNSVKPTTDDSAVTNPNPNPNSNSNSDATITTISDINSSGNGNDGGGSSNNLTSAGDGGSNGGGGGGGATRQSSRTPFTNLSQVDADLALARTLQEQERAYMMLSMNMSGYGRWGTGIYLPDDDEDDDFGDSHEHGYDEGEDDDDEGEEDIEDDMENYNDEDEDAFDVHAHDDESGDSDDNNVELDPSAYSDDEAYARALQDAEEREMAARLLAMAGLTERELVDVDHGGHSQDTWTSDPDELSYEELVALGDVVGTESRGLSADTIASLPSTNYSSHGNKETEADTCVICRLEYEDGDTMTTLPCKHAYHSDCVTDWLKIKKACPVCSAEVSTSASGNSL